MLNFLLFCILAFFCWPLALVALLLYPLVWLILCRSVSSESSSAAHSSSSPRSSPSPSACSARSRRFQNPHAEAENRRMTGTRIDKWLWAARFFKTREQASKACDMNRITSNNVSAKPAREVRIGDMLHIKNEGGEFEIEVLALSQQRGSASIAQTLYRETEASKEARRKAAEERKLLGPLAFTAPSKRPSKRDRRLIHSFRGDY